MSATDTLRSGATVTQVAHMSLFGLRDRLGIALSSLSQSYSALSGLIRPNDSQPSRSNLKQNHLANADHSSSSCFSRASMQTGATTERK